jgi:outer membrane protein assembly factor BamB
VKPRYFIIVLLAFLAIACQPSPASQAPAPASTSNRPAIPPEITNYSKEWPLGNHDYANTRATFDSTINSKNVKTLGVAWTFPLPAGGAYGAAAGNPLIANGVIYMQDLTADTFAIDLKTGKEVWGTTYSNGILGPGGPGIGYGKVFIVARVDEFAALDIKTGKQLWTYNIPGQRPSGAIQPSVFDGRVYITTQAGVAGIGDQTFRGYQPGAGGVAYALNPDTGQPLWQWHAVEEGFWGHPEINSGGGMWMPPAIDTKRGVVYWGTGNPAPFAGIAGYPNGSSRPGPNLYTDSLVALDHQSGKMLWYHQVTQHDLFDHDFQMSPLLITLPITATKAATATNASSNGQGQEIIVGAGKGGRIIAFNRDNGTPLWDTPVGIHQNDNLTELPLKQDFWVYPGILGGVETPMAYADGVIYAQVVDLPAPFNATMWDAKDGTEAVSRAEGGMPMDKGKSEVDALDAATGKILWHVSFDQPGFSAVTVVNDLLFMATFDGDIRALSRTDGRTLWEYQAPGGINAWPAVAGDTIVWPIGIGDGPVLLALRLDATMAIPTPPPLRTPVETPTGG